MSRKSDAENAERVKWDQYALYLSRQHDAAALRELAKSAASPWQKYAVRQALKWQREG